MSKFFNGSRGKILNEALQGFNKRVMIAVSSVVLLFGSVVPGLAGLVRADDNICEVAGEVVGESHVVTYDVGAGGVDVEGRLTEIEVDDGGCAVEWTPSLPSDMTRFLGWFNGEQKFDFSTPIISNIDLVARYSDDAVVYFHDADGVVIDTATQNVRLKAFVAAQTSEFVKPLVDGQILTGWRDGEHTYAIGETFEVGAAEVHLSPVFTDSVMITFNTQGGTAVVPQVIAKGGEATAPVQPTRAGYTFQRWSTSAGGAAYNFSTAVDNDLTLYAVWQGQTVSYTVSVWVQDPNDTSKYVSAGSCSNATSQAVAGSTVTPSGETWLTSRGCTAPSYATFNTAKSTSVVISGTGTSIVNVYYDLTVYTLTFSVNNGLMTIGGVQYSGSNTYKINVRVGQDISSIWPYTGVATFSRTRYRFNGWNPPNTISDSNWVTKRPVFTPEMAGNYTLDIIWVSSNTSETSVEYWFEAPEYSSTKLPSGTVNVDYRVLDGKYYLKSLEYSQKTYSSCPSAKEIDGMVNANRDAANCRLFYNRNRNTLKFDANGGTGSKTETNVWFGRAISELLPANPTRAGYVFEGWFYGNTEVGAIELAAGDLMPNRNVTLVAKWAPDKYVARFYMVEGGGV
jgi:uncharacterized repeat protein (TIGR02543 family)